MNGENYFQCSECANKGNHATFFEAKYLFYTDYPSKMWICKNCYTEINPDALNSESAGQQPISLQKYLDKNNNTSIIF